MDEDRQKLEQLVKKANEMYRNGEYKEPEYGELCHTAVRLVELSEFGRNPAEAELNLPVRQDIVAEIMDGSFDGTAMQLLSIAADLLEPYGTVSLVPYSRGISTRSAMVRFKPK